jgi:hypothetical protein
MEPDGNVANDPHHEFTGRNILFQAHSVEETARHFVRPVEAVRAALDAAEDVLFAARTKRPRPHLDDKILTSWNGLMISAFAKAGAVLDEPKYVAAARGAADFLLATLRREDGTLLRRFRDGDAAIAGMLDDYTFFAQGLLDLYEATFEFGYLTAAIAVTNKQIELLEDEAGGFFASAHEDASRLMRFKDDYDGAEPSGNSIALSNLLRLNRITGSDKFEASARKLIGAFHARLAAAPFGMPQMLAACEFDLSPQREIVIAGTPSGPLAYMIRAQFDPNRILLHADPEIARYQPAVESMNARESQTTVYVCENFACHAPVSTEADLARLLR